MRVFNSRNRLLSDNRSTVTISSLSALNHAFRSEQTVGFYERRIVDVAKMKALRFFSIHTPITTIQQAQL
jgi:hypothetical protein